MVIVLKKLSNDYIVGFIDGEGCFSSVDWKHYTRPMFSICNTFKNILINIKNTLNLNTNVNPKNLKGNSLGKQPQYYLSCTGFDDIRKIVNFFTVNSLIGKEEDFRIFKASFLVWRQTYRPHERHSKKTKDLVKDLYYKKFSYKQISHQTGVPLGTVGGIVKDLPKRNKKRKGT